MTCASDDNSRDRNAQVIYGPPQTTNIEHNRAIFHGHICARARLLQTQLAGMSHLADDEQDRAFTLVDFALERSDRTLWLAVRELLIALSPLMEQAGQRQRWRDQLVRAIARCQEHADSEIEGDLNLQLALQYQLDNQWGQAQGCYEKSIALFGAVQKGQQLVYALSRLAYLHRLQGEIEHAETILDRMNRLIEEHDLRHEFAYFVQGVLAQYRQEWETAESFLEKSLALCKISDEKRLVAKRLRDLGLLSSDRGRLRKAKGYLEGAMAIFQQIHDPVEQATTQLNLGIVYSQMDQPLLALDLYAEAKKVFMQVRDEHHLAYVYNSQGWDYMQIGRWSEAEGALLAAVEFRELAGNMWSLANSLDNLGRVYGHQGNKDLAIRAFDRALAVLDTIPQDVRVLGLRREIVEQQGRPQNEFCAC